MYIGETWSNVLEKPAIPEAVQGDSIPLANWHGSRPRSNSRPTERYTSLNKGSTKIIIWKYFLNIFKNPDHQIYKEN